MCLSALRLTPPTAGLFRAEQRRVIALKVVLQRTWPLMFDAAPDVQCAAAFHQVCQLGTCVTCDQYRGTYKPLVHQGVQKDPQKPPRGILSVVPVIWQTDQAKYGKTMTLKLPIKVQASFLAKTGQAKYGKEASGKMQCYCSVAAEERKKEQLRSIKSSAHACQSERFGLFD